MPRAIPKIKKLYRVNGTPKIGFNTSDEALEDLEETQDALNALMNLVEGNEYEEAQDCCGQILQHMGAIATFLNEKVKQ